jgi:Coenzyme PQQ synthesis protein D (PqqD)
MSIWQRLREATAARAAQPADRANGMYRPAPHVVWAERHGEAVVFDIERGVYERLNEVATSVWARVVDGARFDAIVAAIAEEYELPPEMSIEALRQDVAAVLDRLASSRAIVVDHTV